MKRRVKIYGLLLCAWLMACMCISCSEDVIEDSSTAQQGKKGSVSFLLSGIDAGVSTRAAQNIDFSQYTVKCYVFKQNEESSGYDCTLIQEVDVRNSLITFDNLEAGKHHCFAFFAVRNGYKDKLVLKEYTGTDESSDTYPDYFTPKDAQINVSNFQKCFLQVFDESGLGQNEGFLQAHSGSADEDFMIYGIQVETTPVDTDYQMQKISLKRLLGAVEFNPNNVGKITECKVYSNFYRLYLTQMQVNDATTLNGVTGMVTMGDFEFRSDFAGNWIPTTSTTAALRKEFGEETQRYRIYLPCTTIKTYSENVKIPEVECANTYIYTLSAWDWEDESGGNIPSTPTSVTIGGTEYSIKSPFPIFPNRTTVLTVGNGNQLTVSFKGLSGTGGIDVDNDDWDGWKD